MFLVRKFDIYRHTPKDLTEASLFGAFVSIGTIAFATYLFLWEFSQFLEVKRQTTMFINDSLFHGGEEGEEVARKKYSQSQTAAAAAQELKETGTSSSDAAPTTAAPKETSVTKPPPQEDLNAHILDTLDINLDITFKKIPCDLFSVDAQDVMGSHEVAVHGDVWKYRLDKDGKEIVGEDAKEEVTSTTQESASGSSSGESRLQNLFHTRTFGFHAPKIDKTQAQERLGNGEGCRIAGTMRVNKVPGHVPISTHSHSHMFPTLWLGGDIESDIFGGPFGGPSGFGGFGSGNRDREKQKNLDISHRINHLSFGDDQAIEFVRRNFPDVGDSIAPLERVEQKVNILVEGDQAQPTIFEYYCNVVPSTYKTLAQTEKHVYQYSVNANRLTNTVMPGIYIRYGLSAVTVKFEDTQESFFRFFANILGLIGGLFTVAGLFENVTYNTVQSIMAKKEELGKLG